jgi:hypothetical protein
MNHLKIAAALTVLVLGVDLPVFALNRGAEGLDRGGVISLPESGGSVQAAGSSSGQVAQISVSVINKGHKEHKGSVYVFYRQGEKRDVMGRPISLGKPKPKGVTGTTVSFPAKLNGLPAVTLSYDEGNRIRICEDTVRKAGYRLEIEDGCSFL